MKNKISKNGLIYGLLTGIIFGTLPIISLLNKPATLDQTSIFHNINPNIYQQGVLYITRGGVISLFNDMTTMILITLILFILSGLNSLKTLGNLVKSKAGLYTIIGGFVGGPIGNTLFFSVFVMLNASFGTVFYALEPLIIGIFAFFVFKRSYKWKIWIALSIIILAMLGIALSQIYGTQNVNFGKNATTIGIGVGIGLMGVVAYSVESLLLDRAMSLNKLENVSSLNFLQIKAISSTILELIIVLPLTSVWLASTNPLISFNANVSQNVQISYKAFSDLFSTSPSPSIFLNKTNGQLIPVYPIVLSLILGFFLFVARMFFYKTIQLSGAAMANTLYQSQIIVTPIASGLMLLIGFRPSQANLYNLHWVSQLLFWIFAIIILWCAIYISLTKEPINRLKEFMNSKR